MPLARGDKEYILPAKGVNTEANLLHFPQEHATNALNMEIDYDPMLIRPRKGIATSGSPTSAMASLTLGDNDFAVNTYLWEAVGRDPQLNFVVVQIGRYLAFLDDSQLDDPSSAVNGSKIDLNNVLSGTTEGTLALLETTRVDFAHIKGKLVVTANPIEPSVITYDAAADSFELASLNLKIRNMQGIADGLEVYERTTTAEGMTDDHRYNLLNQGWYKQRRLTAGSATESDPIIAFNTETGEYPSNADIAYLAMVDEGGELIFDSQWLKDQTFGSTPAPKGHYILEAFNMDRNALLTGAATGGGSTGGSDDGYDDAWDRYQDEEF
jgi:hypothetical protein